MTGCFLLSLMCLIAGAHAYQNYYGSQSDCVDKWGSCSVIMQHWGGCYGAYTANMKTHCHGSCPQFCPKPCEWGSWTESQSCDRTCGGGKRLLTRRKLIQEQNNGECLHGDTKAESCNTQECPVCKCKPDMNPRGGWGNCQKRYGSKGLICYVQDNENSGCKDKVRSSSFKPNYYSWEACK